MMAIVLLVLVSALGCGNAERTTGIVGCLNYQYMYNETCYPCPTNCKICVSATNCTVCQRGFYGPVCKDDCDTNCTGTCHKHHGHCTYGCPDGTYPADDNSCQPCPDPCTICKSESHCVLCKDGPCQKTCQEYCVQCNISSGQCLKCNDSFSLQDGQCRHHDLKERTWNTTVISIVVPIIVIVIGIAIAVSVFCFCRHRFVTKKKEPNEKEGRSEQDDDDISDLDAYAAVLLSSENVTSDLDENAFVPLSSEGVTSDLDENASVPLSSENVTSDLDENAAVLLSSEGVTSDLDENASVPLSSEGVTSDLDENASVPLSSEGVIHGLNVEAPGPVPEPEADRSSNRDTGIMLEAQLNSYDTQKLLPKTFSDIASPPNMPYQDSQKLVIKHVPTKTKTRGPYTRPSRHISLKENLTSKVAHQIADDQLENYM